MDLVRHGKEGISRKADRSISKALFISILRRTGIFVADGSGTGVIVCLKIVRSNKIFSPSAQDQE